jgi:RNA polymerase sigma-70 factor (ECF subfamily)
MNTIIDEYYRENYEQLIKRLSYRLGSPENAEDAVQEAFTRAVKYYKSCTSDFDRWFKVIMSNVVKDFQKEIRLAGLTKSIEDSYEELDPIVTDHIRACFRSHMEKLSDSKRSFDKEILRLNILFGYNRKEIAQILGISDRTVKRKLDFLIAEVQELYE